MWPVAIETNGEGTAFCLISGLKGRWFSKVRKFEEVPLFRKAADLFDVAWSGVGRGEIEL